MSEYVSKYKNNVIAKKTRVFFSCALDYGLVFIASLLIFYLALLGSSRLPVSTNNLKKYEDSALKAKKYINTTHLMRYNTSTNETRDINEDAKAYVATLTKTSAYIYDLAYPIEKEDSTFDKEHKVTEEETFMYTPGYYPLDNIGYFFFVFGPEDGTVLDKTYDPSKSETFDEIYLNYCGYGEIEGFVSNFVTQTTEEYQPYKDKLPIYQVLNKDNTSALINRIVYDDTSNKTANELYNNLLIGYKNGVQAGINLVEKNSTTYKAYAKDFYEAYNELCLVSFLSYLLSYIVAYVGLVFIGRGMAGEYITVSQKALNLAFTSKEELTPRGISVFIYHLINFFLYLSMMIIAFFFTGYIGVLNVTLFGPINLFVIEIALLVLVVASIIFMIIRKKNQTLAMFASSLVLKDTREFERNAVESNKLLNTENQNNGDESK